MTAGVDYAFSTPDPGGLFAAGIRFAGRYLGPGTADKHLTRNEALALNGAGIACVTLVESAPMSALGGFTVGALHARQEEAGRSAIGAPGGRPMYFAADWDLQVAQWPRVLDYLAGAASIVGWERVGLYGGLRAMQLAQNTTALRWLFQTYAWSGGQWANGLRLRQVHNGVSLAGGVVDLCQAMTDDYGQWTIGSTVDPPSGGSDMTPDQANQLANLYAGTFVGGPSMPSIPGGTPNASIIADLDYLMTTVATLAAAPAGGLADTVGQLAQQLTTLAGQVQALTDRPLVDAVAVAEAIHARPEIAATIAADVAAQLGTISGSVSLTGSLSGRVGPTS